MAKHWKDFEMVSEKGWMEQRRHERVSATVNITYRVLNVEEKVNVLNYPRYKDTGVIHLPKLAKKFHSYHAVTKDISEGGLSITGPNPFKIGEWVEVSMQPPKYKTPVVMLAEVKWIKSYTQMGKAYYNAGVVVLALDSDSMDSLSRYLLSEKIRMDNENKG
jgi:hypothetical protein